MSKLTDDIPASLPLGSFVIKPKVTRQPKTPDWWFSDDGRRAFYWPSVVGYDYRAGGSGGTITSTLYLYLTSALLHLHGSEADTLYKVVQERVKTK